MATRERPIEVADRMTRRTRRVLGEELHAARKAAGLAQRDVARAAGMSHPQVSRIEQGRLPGLSLEQVSRLAAPLGLELVVRLYPAGDPIRDAGHAALLDRLRRHLHPSLGWRTEVALPIPGDRRAWDAVITGTGWRVGVEAETRLADLQAVARKLALKARDGGVDTTILLVADTRSNRAFVRAARGEWAPGTANVVEALRSGVRPADRSLVLL